MSWLGVTTATWREVAVRTGTVGTLVSVVGALVLLFNQVLERRALFAGPDSTSVGVETIRIDRIGAAAREARLASRIDALERRLAAADSQASLRSSSAVDRIALGALAHRQATADARMKRLEDVILPDPAKAIDLVLLHRDIDALRGTVSATGATAKQDIDRIYDLTKWIVGLLFTMSLGILGLAAANVFKAKAGDAGPNATGTSREPGKQA